MQARTPRFPSPRTVPEFQLDRDLTGLRIGWLADWGGAHAGEPGIPDHCEAALRQMETMGAVVEALPRTVPADTLWSAWVKMRAMLNASGKRALAEDPAKRALTKPETIWEIERSRRVSAQAVYEVSVIRSRWHPHAARLFQRYDAVVLPSAQVWGLSADRRWPEDIAGRKMDTYHRWMEVVIPASLIGLPALSVPVGFGPQDLRMSMQIIGRSGDDRGVLSIGQAWNRATEWAQLRPPVLD